MNKSYKTIWNESLGAWVAASELATGRSKSSRSRKATRAVLAAGILLQAGVMAPSVAGALDNGTVAAGSGQSQLAYGFNSNTAGAGANNNAIAIGINADASATDAIAIGTQVTNNAARSILMGNNNVTLDAGSAGSVVFAPSGAGTGTPVTGSTNSFVYINAGNPNTVTNSSEAVAIGGTATNANTGIAIGSSSKVTALGGTAVGVDSAAQGKASIARRLAVARAAQRSSAVARNVVQVPDGAGAFSADGVDCPKSHGSFGAGIRKKTDRNGTDTGCTGPITRRKATETRGIRAALKAPSFAPRRNRKESETP